MSIDKKYYILKNVVLRNTMLFLEGQVLYQKRFLFNVKSDEPNLRNFSRLIKQYSKTYLISDILYAKVGDTEYMIPLDKIGAFDCKLPYYGIEKTPQIEFYFLINNHKIVITDIFPHTIWNFTGNTFGVISDVDDTIMISYSFAWDKIWQIFFKNPYNRIPVECMHHFYQELEKKGGEFFYVSNSEYNLYFNYREFIQLNHFPSGPLYLSPRIIKQNILNIRHLKKQHKITTISQIMKYFPKCKFLLVGDSGQMDVKIYYSIVKKFPDRVGAIVIRDVGFPEKEKYVRKIMDKIDKKGTPCFLTKSHMELNNILDNIEEYMSMT